MPINKNHDFRILIIDDNPEIHHDFITILTSFDASQEFDLLGEKLFGQDQKTINNTTSEIILPKFQIDTATQGKEGVEQILSAIKQGNPYALAFVDIRMPPGWDGIVTIKHIWELDKDIQIVICTAYSDYSWEETIAALGQTDNLLILKKPFDHIAVRQLAYALTRKWKLMQEARTYTQSLEKTVQERTEELQFQATHDVLTTLPNRVLLEDRIKNTINECQRDHLNFAIVFFDLDRFKLINDSLSHTAGDTLLRIISERLQANVRKSDTLARIGGDEFVLIIRDISNPDEVSIITKNLLNLIARPLTLMDRTLSVTSSAGICLYPNDGLKLEQLIRNADTAMYRAKKLGGNQYYFYTTDLNEESVRALTLESELRHAINNYEFFLCYQPQIDLKTNKLVAVEALIRWDHPERGILPPLDFIPTAEETGLILPIGEWVLRTACEKNKAWQNAGLLPIRIAVNVTSQQINNIRFLETVKTVLNDVKLDPQYLELELTESTLINNPHTIEIINALKDIGVYIALDDFGTGYSSLSYLRNIPLDRLKIDRSFIQNILTNHGDEIVVQAIITMARGLNLEVLAEGVETKKQMDILKSKNCNEIQGFYFSQPLSEIELTDALKDKSNMQEIIENKLLNKSSV
jgi:diguanylate cyclase (GGDEF)-like protein